jgi:hypothetical protein
VVVSSLKPCRQTLLEPYTILTWHLDGILDVEFAKVLSEGTGSLHGIDSSEAMIEAAKKLCKDSDKCTFTGRTSLLPLLFSINR